MKDKIITFLLMSIIIAILGVIGTLGYMVYKEITAEGTIQIHFEENTGFPKIEYIPSINESIELLDDEMFFVFFLGVLLFAFILKFLEFLKYLKIAITFIY